MNQPFRYPSGFSLVELLLALSLIATLSLVAIPGAMALVRDSEISSQINNFQTHLNLARSEAIKRGKRTAVCPMTSNGDCAPGTYWGHGWITFIDANANRDLDPAEPVLARQQQPAGAVSLYSTPGRKLVVFRPDGRATGSNGTYTFCDKTEASAARAVILSNSGRARSSMKNSANQPLVCP